MSESRCTVQERTWKDELPELPDDLSALLAPPVVVRFDTVVFHATADDAHRTAGLLNPHAVATVA
ncbi:hypothetical protein ABT369_27185 [Dactylosporangium sp. NPDC000244]|uniref:hypothetical protein n=1 Tax=Dactylosporangium sp. NPDC000244 TaxID=3154365 RepID=UPI00331E2D14